MLRREPILWDARGERRLAVALLSTGLVPLLPTESMRQVILPVSLSLLSVGGNCSKFLQSDNHSYRCVGHVIPVSGNCSKFLQRDNHLGLTWRMSQGERDPVGTNAVSFSIEIIP